MAAVDPLFAQWLQSPSEKVVRADAAATARWGASAAASERLTGIATRAAAQIEADRQLAFFSRGPFAEDVHQLVGTDWEDELGRVVTLYGSGPGYEDGADVLVLGVQADRATGLSSVTVLLPLGGL